MMAPVASMPQTTQAELDKKWYAAFDRVAEAYGEEDFDAAKKAHKRDIYFLVAAGVPCAAVARSSLRTSGLLVVPSGPSPGRSSWPLACPLQPW